MGRLEVSHRSKDFENVLNRAKSLILELFKASDAYDVLFLQGGASLQFYMIPLNFLSAGRKADYIITGSWAQKAAKEAKRVGSINVMSTEENGIFKRIPALSELSFSKDSCYAHLTSNNTIFGTQWKEFPDTGDVPLFADMSSDIMSRWFDINRFSLIYAGAQKNMGPAGVTVVIIKKSLLAKANDAPTMLSYKIHAENNSLYNTPCVFGIYIISLVMQWIRDKGGLSAIETVNNKKGELLYGTMDAYPDFYRGTVNKDSRSLMNVTFRLPTEELENKFLAQAKEKGFAGLKGHRSVGGIRVSMYNYIPFDGVEKLTDFMKEFVKNNS
jgi:phosphoserine aminotransferase